MITPEENGGGLGFDAQWNDDFHHALHALLTGERDGYYADFGAVRGSRHARSASGFVYAGQLLGVPRPSVRRSSARARGGDHFVVFAQNHDQIGNRTLGDRLTTIVDPRARPARGRAPCSSRRFMPLLFMGEEYGETQPFQYFVDHGDPALIEAVRRGRKTEFADFHGRATRPMSPRP